LTPISNNTHSFFFGQYWGLNSGPLLVRYTFYHLRHSLRSFCFLVIFQKGSHVFYPGQPRIETVLPMPPMELGLEMCSTTPGLLVETRVSPTFSWASLKPWSSQSLPLSSWDDRHEPLRSHSQIPSVRTSK
jgi:hypothetical protein